MEQIRVLVGTRKGAFILRSDGKRQCWQVDGPFFGGWEVYHVAGSPADPERLYAAQSSEWFGQIIQRSDDGGRSWQQPGTAAGEAPGMNPDGSLRGQANRFDYDTAAVPLGDHQWYDGSATPWTFKRVWQLKPSFDDADTLYAGVEDAALFRSQDGGASWQELAGLRGHGSGPLWQPGAGGMCLHTILLDRERPQRFYIAISAAGAFRSDDGGDTWQPINRGLQSGYIPDPTAEVGHCVHKLAMHPARSEVLYMQKHWDVMRSDDAGANWYEVSGNLPTDFGFAIDVHAHDPDVVYVVPIKSDMEHYPPDGRLCVWRSSQGGNEWQALGKGLPQKNCYVNVLRDAMAVDQMDDCGIYFGTTGGQVYCSPDGGEHWLSIVDHLPPVLSVEVQTLR